MNIETQSKLHDIMSKLVLGLKLTPRERSFYLLYCNCSKEIKEFLELEKQSKEVK